MDAAVSLDVHKLDPALAPVHLPVELHHQVQILDMVAVPLAPARPFPIRLALASEGVSV
jgi:hypothetical protein